MVCAWGGRCAHVASSEGCLCFRCLLEVCVRTWLAAAVCLFTWISLCVYLRVCGWRKCVHVCCLFGGCVPLTGSVLVAWGLCLCSPAIGCVLWWVRARGAVHSIQPLLFDCGV